jgi:D-alanyl-D-alanine carboxypeptidase (penicillin-binding protein 5/6)
MMPKSLFRISMLALFWALFLGQSCLAGSLTAPFVAARAYYVLELESDQPLAALESDQMLEPASLTKLMTAYLSFAALKQNQLTLNQKISWSEELASAQGIRMFLDKKTPATVDDLLHGLIVTSANDAALALAVTIAGSESAFVAKMNSAAKRLGMAHSHFTNATGQPQEQHFSSARDLALLSAALIRDFPEYYPLFSQREYRYNNVSQISHNRLLWLDASVDGMAAGFSQEGQYNLVSSAQRGQRRIITVILGSPSSNARTFDSQKLLNWGFQSFQSQKLYSRGTPIKTLEVYKGNLRRVAAGFREDIWVTAPVGNTTSLKETLTTFQPVVAPVVTGQKLGSLDVLYDGRVVASHELMALEDILPGNAFTRSWDSLRLILR